MERFIAFIDQFAGRVLMMLFLLSFIKVKFQIDYANIFNILIISKIAVQ